MCIVSKLKRLSVLRGLDLSILLPSFFNYIRAREKLYRIRFCWARVNGYGTNYLIHLHHHGSRLTIVFKVANISNIDVQKSRLFL